MFSHSLKKIHSRTTSSNNYLKKLIAPKELLYELDEHQKEIQQKSNISPGKFVAIKEELLEHIDFIQVPIVTINKAKSISPDPNDVAFIALEISEKTMLWLNDKRLKNQKRVLVLNTQELVQFRV